KKGIATVRAKAVKTDWLDLSKRFIISETGAVQICINNGLRPLPGIEPADHNLGCLKRIFQIWQPQEGGSTS
ncbi:hypothetical protein, partial [Candidatus Electronema sp. TJ]|uniref:hypothetical protein n=1 Tax=Candidatus Electronema sp. TJ TaxID=3401573 RepID=UPI003AA8E359